MSEAAPTLSPMPRRNAERAFCDEQIRANHNANSATLAHLRFLQRAEMIDFPAGSAGSSITDDVWFSIRCGIAA